MNVKQTERYAEYIPICVFSDSKYSHYLHAECQMHVTVMQQNISRVPSDR